MPRQELPEVFWQNGYVDVIRPRTVLELGSMCGRRILPFVVEEAIADLDYPDQIPELEQAVARFQANPNPETRCKRHPA
jgi:hypothetical protein